MEFPVPATVAAAEEMQRDLAARVVIRPGVCPPPRTAAGLDVSYAVGSDRVVAAAVVVDVESGVVLEEVHREGTAAFPYVPGLLAFREAPILLDVLASLRLRPDVLVCDGQGIAHPRGCGVACHLGVVTGLPAVGCAKTRFVGTYDEPGPRRGDRAVLWLDGREVGRVLRTRDRIRPVFVSPGHLLGVEEAADLVLSLCTGFRVPEPVRRADALSRRVLRAASTRP